MEDLKNCKGGETMLKVLLKVLMILAEKYGGKFLDILADVLKNIFDTVPNGSVKEVERIEASGGLNVDQVVEIMEKHEPEMSKRISGKIMSEVLKNGSKR